MCPSFLLFVATVSSKNDTNDLKALHITTSAINYVDSCLFSTSINFQNDLNNGFAGILLAAPRGLQLFKKSDA